MGFHRLQGKDRFRREASAQDHTGKLRTQSQSLQAKISSEAVGTLRYPLADILRSEPDVLRTPPSKTWILNHDTRCPLTLTVCIRALWIPKHPEAQGYQPMESKQKKFCRRIAGQPKTTPDETCLNKYLCQQVPRVYGSTEHGSSPTLVKNKSPCRDTLADTGEGCIRKPKMFHAARCREAAGCSVVSVRECIWGEIGNDAVSKDSDEM